MTVDCPVSTAWWFPTEV